MNLTTKELIQIRMQGQKPDTTIIVSMVGPLRIKNPVIIHRDNNGYVGLIELDVVIAHIGQNISSIIDLVNRILNFKPLQLETWNLSNNEWVSIESYGQRILKRVPPSW